MQFPVSGVEVNPLVPLLVAFVVSALTAPVGVSGAFLLSPFQVSVLGNVREGRVAWPLAWVVILGTLPGVFIGVLSRVTLLSDPARFVSQKRSPGNSRKNSL